MPPPRFQIYRRPRVTFVFNLLTHEVKNFMPVSRGSLVPICIEIRRFFRFQNIVFMHLVTDERSNKRTGRSKSAVLPPPARLAWRRHIKSVNPLWAH